MKGWLLDTNVLSELRRPRPEPKVVDGREEPVMTAKFTESVVEEAALDDLGI